MSDTRETHQELGGSVQGGPGEEGGVNARVLQTEEEEEEQAGGGGDPDGGPAGSGDDDQMQQQPPHQPGVPQGPGRQQEEAPRWYRKRILKMKTLFLLPFRKINKFYVRRCRSTYYYYGDDPGGCCCRCFRPPPAISPPRFMNPGLPGCRNPNPSSYEFVKYMIETNDFYAPHCNVHGGASGCPHNSGDEE